LRHNVLCVNYLDWLRSRKLQTAVDLYLWSLPSPPIDTTFDTTTVSDLIYMILGLETID